MTTVICPSCGEDVFTITGWAAADHCPYCGRSLAIRRIGIEQTHAAQREMIDDAEKPEVATPDTETAGSAR